MGKGSLSFCLRTEHHEHSCTHRHSQVVAVVGAGVPGDAVFAFGSAAGLAATLDLVEGHWTLLQLISGSLGRGLCPTLRALPLSTALTVLGLPEVR